MTHIALEIADGIARVTLDEPERGNPFGLELSRVATACHENRDVRTLTDHAAGRHGGRRPQRR